MFSLWGYIWYHGLFTKLFCYNLSSNCVGYILSLHSLNYPLMERSAQTILQCCRGFISLDHYAQITSNNFNRLVHVMLAFNDLHLLDDKM